MSDATPIQRAFELFGLLFFDNRFYSLDELASRLDVSKPTVTRLITRLENSKFGMINRKIIDRKAWYKFEPGMNLSRLKINVEGLYVLAMCKDFLAEILPDKMVEQMEMLLKRLDDVLPKGHIQKKRNLGYSLNKGKINYEPHMDPYPCCWRR